MNSAKNILSTAQEVLFGFVNLGTPVTTRWTSHMENRTGFALGRSKDWDLDKRAEVTTREVLIILRTTEKGAVRLR